MEYEFLASVYDEFMEDTPYEKWRDIIVSALKERGITEGIVLDMGCGTGKMTRLLKEVGFDMIGVDNSVEMLRVAYDNTNPDDEILYLNQDMTEFELYGTVRAVVSICDCVNYVTNPDDLLECFKLVNNYLDPDGVFIFDFNTEYKYKEVIGDSVIAENRENASFIWENYYDEAPELNEYDVTLFIKDEESDMYVKNTETHVQRGYTLNQMRQIIEDSGLIFEKAFDEETLAEPTAESERIFVIAREKGK